MTLAWADVERVDIRVGVVADAKEFPEVRRPADRLWIDVGPFVSEVLVLGAYGAAGEVVRLRSDHDVAPGWKIG